MARPETPPASPPSPSDRRLLSAIAGARSGACPDPGHPIPPDTRQILERSFGRSLADVRLHGDALAHRVAGCVSADAVTAGHHVYVGSDAPSLDTPAGMRLLAHEVAHCLQQASGVGAGIRAGDWCLSRPGDPWEREADRMAEAVLSGAPALAPETRPAAATATRGGLLQRHVSFEHRLLGDGPTADLVSIATGGSRRGQVLSNQLSLVQLWRDDPGKVNDQDVTGLCPWIRTVRLGPDGVLATYGELNALPDYLADAQALDSLPAKVLLPILQVIRQEGFNQLTALSTGTNPSVRFRDSAAEPWKLSLVNNIVETGALDTLTFGLGARGENHYQGLLGRNACHFAPFSWYRWQASHLVARDLAARAHAAGGDPLLTHQAWVYQGYADHFLQDSFAAGHLVNKTLVMQWFIEWAASQSLLPVADWDVIKDLTAARQPRLAGRWLYDPRGQGPSNDPQTVQEAATLADRIVASGVVADRSSEQAAAYQRYLTFLTSAATQLASANLHDYYNDHSAWVSSLARSTPYEVWGDSTLFTGANGGAGVEATSETAQMSQEAIREILAAGTSSISTSSIREHFPTKAGPSSTVQLDLQAWNDSQRDYCVNTSFPAFRATLKTILLGLASPRLGVVSQDQSFATAWDTSLPRAGYLPVTNLFHQGRLFVGSNGYLYELDPTSGAVLHSLLVTDSVGAGDYATELATDGTTLFAGVHGYVYGVRLADWSRAAWSSGVGGTAAYQRVSVLARDGRVFAGSNGYVYELDPATGRQLHSLLLGSRFGQGDYTTQLATDGASLFVGMHGYVYGVRLGDWSRAAWYSGVGGTGAYPRVSVLAGDGRLFAGSNGYVYQFDPSSGRQIHELLLTGRLGLGDYTTRLATDGNSLFAGVHGYVYGVRLADWSRSAWSVGVGGTAAFPPVSVLAQGDRLLAGSNGYVYRLDKVSGRISQQLLLTYIVGIGDFDTSVTTDGRDLLAGVHGFSYKVVVNDTSPSPTEPQKGTLPMPASQSNLSAPRYGYDFVVATTQASINATMKQFLSGLTEPVVAVCYVADTKGNPVPIAYDQLIKQTDGADPFSVPDDADPTTNEDLKRLLAARFMMGFKAQIGLPPGVPAARVPDLVELGSDTSAVTFNLLCSQFQVVELDPGGGYSSPSWMNLSQPAGDPWTFTSKVDLRLSTTDQSAYSKLPPDVQEKIKNLGSEAFSVQQLLFDLDNAALETVPTISGVKPGTKLYSVLQQSFLGAYFTQLQSGGQPVLGCTIKQQGQLLPTLALTDLNLEVCPYLGANGQPVSNPTPDQQDLATLNYLCAADRNLLPPAVTFGWNWIDPSEVADYDGVIAINRSAMVNYFKTQLQQYVTNNCFLPYVRVYMDGLNVMYSWNLTRGQAPTVTTPATGTQVLVFDFSADAEDCAGLNCDMGKMELKPSFRLTVDFSGNTITVVQHLVIYLYVRSLATSGDGNIVDLTITDTYTLAIDQKGQLVVGAFNSQPQDNSQNPSTNDFLNFWTNLNEIINSVKNWTRAFAPTNFTDIPVSIVQDYVFPGGRTFVFKSVAFSDYGDLASHITYADPS